MRCNACYCYELWLSSPITQVFVTAWPGLNTWSEALLEHLLFRYARKNLVVVNIYIKVSHSELFSLSAYSSGSLRYENTEGPEGFPY